ncbi:MAG: hypothetical protein AAFU53_01225 [Cyanobacteria bacterium J06632_3]
MAIVLALLIVGWLVAFALGAQSGFDSEPVAETTASATTSTSEAPATYRKPASVS